MTTRPARSMAMPARPRVLLPASPLTVAAALPAAHRPRARAGSARLRRARAVLAALVLALAALTGFSENAQAQTEIWSGTMTVGLATIGDLRGYRKIGLFPVIGELDDTEFTIGTTTHTIKSILRNSAQANERKLVLGINPTLADTANVVFRVGNSDFSLDSTDVALGLFGGGTSYEWNNPALAWSDGDSVAVSLTHNTVPDAPTGLTARANGQTQIELGWTAPTNTGNGTITGYKVEVSADGTTNWTGIGGTLAATARSYSHTGLTAGTERHYRVRAVNALGDGAPSAVQSATTEAATQTASTVTLTPSYLGLGTGTATFCIGLTPPAGETFSSAEITALNNGVSVTNGSVALLPHCLALETSVGGGVLGIPIDPGAAVNTVTIALPADTVETDASTTDAPEYFAADPLTVNVALDGNTVTAAATPATIVPGAPTIGQVEPIGQKQLNVGWRAPTGTGIGLITGYKVEVSETGTGGWTGIGGTLAATARIYHHGGLTAGTTRYYRVRAVNALGDGAWSAVASGTTEAASTVTNAPPVFTSGSAAFSVAENATSTGMVMATDADSGDEVTYAITGGADRVGFSIDSTSGELTFNAAPDYETPTDVASTTPSNAAANNEYIVVVTATGGTGDREMTAEQTVTVTVTNVDEAGTVTLSDAQPVVGRGLRAALDDPDGGVTDKTTVWEKSADGQSGWSVIAGWTAGIYTPVAGDANQYLRATAMYTDGHGPNKRAQAVSDNAVAPPPEMSITAGTSPVTEGTAATFTLDVAPKPGATTTYTVIYTVGESGDMVAAGDEGTGKTITFSWNGISRCYESSGLCNPSANILSIRTVTDTTTESDSVVTVTLTAVTQGSATLAATASAMVRVEDDDVSAPAAPVLSAAAGDSLVTLTWSASDTGGAPITGYEYRRSADGGTTWSPDWGAIADSAPGGANDDSFTVSGLTNGTQYTFEVRAVNKAGDGAVSNRAMATPAAFTDTITVEAVATLVEEGTAAAFTLARTVSTAALEVTVAVTETGAMIEGTAPTSVEFGVGESTKTLTVETANDALDEADSVITAAAGTGTGYAPHAMNGAAEVTVTDDDPFPTVSVKHAALSVEEDAGNVTWCAVLDTPSGRATAVHVATSDGSATGGRDYFRSSFELDISAGDMERCTVFPVIDDSEREDAARDLHGGP